MSSMLIKMNATYLLCLRPRRTEEGLVGIEPYHFFTRVDFDDIAEVGTFNI